MENNVKYLRRSREFDLTQDELAAALNVSRGTISRIEKGGEISGAVMLRVANFFGKDAREIFFENNVV